MVLPGVRLRYVFHSCWLFGLCPVVLNLFSLSLKFDFNELSSFNRSGGQVAGRDNKGWTIETEWLKGSFVMKKCAMKWMSSRKLPFAAEGTCSVQARCFIQSAKFLQSFRIRDVWMEQQGRILFEECLIANEFVVCHSNFLSSSRVI